MMSVAGTYWLLGKHDLGMPVCFKDHIDRVFRFTGRSSAPWFERLPWPLTSWDLHRTAAASVETLETAEVHAFTCLLQFDTEARIWICSGRFELAVELARTLGRNIYWLASDGCGATEKLRDHRAWREKAYSCLVDLVDLSPDGHSAVVGSLEQRIQRSSPGATQYTSLSAAASLTRGLVLNTRLTTRPRDLASSLEVPLPQRAWTDRLISRASLDVSIAMRKAALRFGNAQDFEDHWRIGVALDRSTFGHADCMSGDLPPAEAFYWLPDSHSHFIADPMIAEVDGSPVLFFEQLDHATRETRILAVPINEHGRPGIAPVVVLDPPHHISFPGIIRDPADPCSIYLLPEQAGTGKVVLYRSLIEGGVEGIRFTEEAVLLDDFPGIDPVMQRIGSTWYLFVTDGRYGNFENNLHLFVSTDLRGPFKPHPLSPIHSGLRGSRMAGQLILRGRHWYRAGQDCRARYGSGIVFFRIDDISASRYSETESGVIDRRRVARDSFGVHTFSRCGNIVAIDTLNRPPIRKR
jgi:hypothetical protein